MSFHTDMPRFFSGPYIDRRVELRERADALEQARRDPATRYVVSIRGLHLLQDHVARIAFLTADHPLAVGAGVQDLVLLGEFDGACCILIDLPTQPAALPMGTALRELRPLAGDLEAPEAALLAYARALTLWRSRHRFCGTCGAPMHPARAGHVMACANPVEPHEVFPRIDPAIIVLVTDGPRALLGRQPGWPVGRYSAIAGFVEPGESLEDAVAREVREETGVGIASLSYHSSQPWPFPASLMLGFHAIAGSQVQIHLGDELEDARWFDRDELAAGRIQLPPPHAIAHQLISAWLRRPGPG